MNKPFTLSSTAVVFIFGIIALVVAPGCPSTTSSTTSPSAATSGTAQESQFRGPLLRNALHMLNHLENFDQEPALEQVVDRLNQWGRSQVGAVDWKPDPLISTLPKQYQNAVWFEKLDDKSYDHDLDGNFLMEASWLRDISNHVRGRDLYDLAVAQALFDWTIRNVQLIEPPKLTGKQNQVAAAVTQMVLRRLPADVLLQGQGTMTQRAWVFMLLGRQQGLDIVMLAVPDPDRSNQPRPWLPALVRGDQLYLFDTSLGLPIPGPGGKGVATLALAAEDESILNGLDLDESHHYPIKAAEAKQAMAFIEASPGYLSRRMKALESQLVAAERVALTVSAEQVAKRLKGVSHLAPDVKLWTLPYETLALRQLEQSAPRGFRDLLGRETAPFKVPGYHGDRSTVLKPGERLATFTSLVQEEDAPSHKINTAVTPGKFDSSAKIVFTVKSAGADFDHLSIEFKNDGAIEAGRETVVYDSSQTPRPRLEVHIAEGKTKVKDIVHAVENDPVARQVVEVVSAPGASEEGLVGAVDSVNTSRMTLRRTAENQRPVQIVFPLWAARLLHFRGLYDGENGAKHFYMVARPGNDQFDAYVSELLTDYKEATKQDPTPAFARDCQIAMARRKQAATFWLGMVSFDEAQYDAAADYFKMVALETSPQVPSPWLNAAKYNLARCHEAAGRKADAIKLLEEDDSPQRYGNRLRARRLNGS